MTAEKYIQLVELNLNWKIETVYVVERPMRFLSRVKESIVRNLVNPKQEYRGIKDIQIRELAEPVYNFSTPTHTYCVSDGLVVHNCDTISMLSSLTPWKPSAEATLSKNTKDDMWELPTEKVQQCLDNYIV